jgi:membrane protein
MRKYIRQIQVYTGQRAKKIILPGFQKQNLHVVGTFYFHALSKGNIGLRAAGISFKFIIALFPLCIFLFSLIPFIPIENMQSNLMTAISKSFPTPEIFHFFEQFLTDIVEQKHTVLLSVGFLLSIYFAANAVSALTSGLTSSYYITNKQKFWQSHLWSIILLFIFLFMFILSFLISSFGSHLIEYMYEQKFFSHTAIYYTLLFIKSCIAFLFFMLSVSFLYNVAHIGRIKWNFFNIGAFFSTILIILLKETFGLYLTYFGKFDQIYGQFGVALAALLFVYYIFFLLIIGFELNMSIQTAVMKKIDPTEPRVQEVGVKKEEIIQNLDHPPGEKAKEE